MRAKEARYKKMFEKDDEKTKDEALRKQIEKNRQKNKSGKRVPRKFKSSDV